MIEIQCTSCHTRYRIEEREITEEAPTFKCSRCGHVFTQAIAKPAIAPTPGPQSPSAPARSTRSKPVLVRKQGDRIPSSADLSSDSPRPELQSAAEQKEDAAAPSDAEQAPPAAKPAAAASPSAPASPAPSKSLGSNLDSPASRGLQPPASRDLSKQPLESPNSEPPSAHSMDLAFDFGGEEPFSGAAADDIDEAVEPRDRGWQVGDVSSATFELPAQSIGRRKSAPPIPELFEGEADVLANDDPDYEEYSAPPSRRAASGPGKIHSAGFFAGLSMAIAAAFLVVSMVLCGAPMASARLLSMIPGVGARFIPPVTPASLVALTNLNAGYQAMKEGHRGLVITGKAKNVGPDSLHEVQIEVSLLDRNQHEIVSESVYCGANLSLPMVTQMTPHELEFLQKLEPPSGFALDPSQSHSFALIFVDPPASAGLFRVRVTRAQEPAAPAADD